MPTRKMNLPTGGSWLHSTLNTRKGSSISTDTKSTNRFITGYSMELDSKISSIKKQMDSDSELDKIMESSATQGFGIYPEFASSVVTPAVSSSSSSSLKEEALGASVSDESVTNVSVASVPEVSEASEVQEVSEASQISERRTLSDEIIDELDEIENTAGTESEIERDDGVMPPPVPEVAVETAFDVSDGILARTLDSI